MRSTERGAVYAEIGQIDKAVSDLEKGIELSDDPELVEATKQLLNELKQ